MINILQKIATTVPQPTVGGNSVWAFRSSNAVCETIAGPWGEYQICPKYTASVSDKKGNRLVLTCSTEKYGIEFRVKLANEVWTKLQDANIQVLSFGTNNLNQSMGVPYVIYQDRTLLADEVLSPDLMTQLKSAKSVNINVRANSGEKNIGLQFYSSRFKYCD